VAKEKGERREKKKEEEKRKMRKEVWRSGWKERG
jgi:hypothetical protein